MFPDRAAIVVPSPFEGASTWLKNAYRPLATQATDLQSGVGDNKQALREELKFRRQLAGYLHRYRQEARKLCDKWERQAEQARRRKGISSPEFTEASTSARLFVELLQSVHPDENRNAIKQLEEVT